MKIVLLASAGRHPASLRPRVATEEARALALALTLPGATVEALHAGPAAAARMALAPLLGMGAASLHLIDLDADADAVPALVETLRRLRPNIVLAGTRAESGEASGLVPYLVAEQLGMPIATAITQLAPESGRVAMTQALSGGKRRRVAATLPVLITVDRRGPAPRLAALAGMRRREIIIETASNTVRDAQEDWTVSPARARPKRLLGPKDNAQPAKGKQLLRDLDADSAAKAILDYLQQEGLAAPAAAAEPRVPRA